MDSLLNFFWTAASAGIVNEDGLGKDQGWIGAEFVKFCVSKQSSTLPHFWIIFT